MAAQAPFNNYFLGLEIALDQLRAAVVDANLTVLGYETVDFDSELQFGTRGGLFTTVGDAYTTPVDMWVKALDILFQKLADRFDLSKVKSIGGSAHPATVWLTSEAGRTLATLSPNDTLSLQITPSDYSLIHTPVAQDTSTLQQTLVFQAALGGPDAMAARVGVASHPSLVAVQCMKIREGNPDAWRQTARVMMASTFLSSVLAGRFLQMTESEVTGTGLWNPSTASWDMLALEVVAGSPDQARRFAEMLGGVEMQGGRNVATISQYFVERYGLDKDAFIVPFTSDRLASYLSVAPTNGETVLSFGAVDALMVPASQYIPSKLYTLHPHPVQDPSEPRRYIAVLTNRNADAARAMVRDMYTKSWSAFDRLISVIPPGGSIGLDDKLFSFWVLHNEAPASWNLRKGVYRIETGHRVNEFRDLRANPRCLLESQLLTFRVQYARMMASPLFAGQYVPSNAMVPVSLRAYRAGTYFNPYDKDLCPNKIVAIGSAANFPSIVAMIGDMFNAKVYVPTGSPTVGGGVSTTGSTTPVRGVESSPGGGASPIPPNSANLSLGPNTPSPSRFNGALGSAFTARWAWRRIVRPEEKFGSFEEEVRTLLKKKWTATSALSPIAGGGPVGYPQPKRSGLAAGIVFREDEDQPVTPPGALTPPAMIGLGIDPITGMPTASTGTIMRARTPTTSSQATNSTVLTQLSIATLTSTTSTAQTSPGGATTPISGGCNSAVPLNVCVSPLAGTTEDEFQAGLCKVAEADLDAFMTYASIVPEFCRIEGMLIKGY